MAIEISQERRGGLWSKISSFLSHSPGRSAGTGFAIRSTGAEPKTRHRQRLGSGSINPRFAQSGHQILPSGF
ncbi:uncharacterized protein PgNI_07466 [Pyricularia grisea]|uniref:Uncharacterized protein n=1 Tax=Pyricularia grisea TaxID=148305 RepID=A0A6P8B2A8_PYRGI|nr:uncharacterized protein PgNI_07466 [Pyricularia grisea]TLD08986.1 hypothetical protein PgNI_07466 [Pyricularia grisea]